jgi:hypothetical protein
MGWATETSDPTPNPAPCGNRRSERVKELDTIMAFACQRLSDHEGDHAAVSIGGFIARRQFGG